MIEAGARVERKQDPTQHGCVLKRDGKRVRVDFSASGGRSSAWVMLHELQERQRTPDPGSTAIPEGVPQ
eukprot:COSAG05_NODE_12495_length_465_cov_10.871585_2_plen_68_part_01